MGRHQRCVQHCQRPICGRTAESSGGIKWRVAVAADSAGSAQRAGARVETHTPLWKKQRLGSSYSLFASRIWYADLYGPFSFQPLLNAALSASAVPFQK